MVDTQANRARNVHLVSSVQNLTVSLSSFVMKIAIIGSGISGLTCGWLLNQKHDIQIFEAGIYIGGHTNTVDFDLDGQSLSVDTGFIVCNDRTYPNFLSLIDHLQVSRQPSEMSFSVRCDQTGVEYSGSGLGGLFVQRRNMLRPSFLKMVADILRFNRHGTRDADILAHDMTVGEYLDLNRYGEGFAERYLLPMGASIWSCPVGTFRNFPMRFILEFYKNHGLLSITNRPQWYVIEGGARNYVAALTSQFVDRISLNTPVVSVHRTETGVDVVSSAGASHFDEVIFACHSDQALQMLIAPTATEQDLLTAFPYQPNEAVLHTDISLLPRNQKAWSSWNYCIRPESADAATLTYNMNILQHIKCSETICVSLNDVDNIAADKVIQRFQYAHPVFSTARHQMQSRHSEVIRTNRTSFCGAYWGNGFHEDGVVSALAVCQKFGARDILDQQLSASVPETASGSSVGA